MKPRDINPEDERAKHALKLQYWARKCPTWREVTNAVSKNDQARAAAREKLVKLLDQGYRTYCSQRRWKLERLLDDLVADRLALDELSSMYGGLLESAGD